MNFYFNKPISLGSGWQANFVIQIRDYTISIAGDDSQSGSQTSKRHYLYITKNDDDITEELGFPTYGVFNLLDVIDKVRELAPSDITEPIILFSGGGDWG